MSEHTQKLTEGYFEFKSLGAARVKGVTEPVNIYEVLGVGPLRTRLQVAARRGLVRFVGRQSELEQMKKALGLARGGHGQIVGVMGEPGVGKSRLFLEFKLVSQRGCLVLETFSVPYGKAYPYLPLIDLLKNYFHITPQDDERQRREKITGKVLTLDRNLEDALPYLFFLLGVAEPTSPLSQMDPQIRKRRTFEAIKQLLVRESLNQPLILIFEDLHWLDNETQAFLTLLSESLAPAGILLLVNYRPEYRHDWGNKTFYIQLRLDPLRQAEAQEMLTALLGDGTALQPRKQFILTKTEGNPFFMEEIVQALREQGVLARDLTIGAHGVRPLPTDLHLPPTVQGVLAARIDRLPAAEKELQRPYFLALLAEAYGKVGQIEDGLSVLVEALAMVDKTAERFYGAELYRLRGTLTLQKFQVSSSRFQVADPRPTTPDPQVEAEECFLKAIEIARRQSAKSLELRAVMSLSRLRQQQGKREEARQMLAEIYGWFTEGFDTADLQEAKALLEELA